MARLKSDRDVPIWGWVYFEPATRVWFEGTTLADLIAKVTAHRKYRGLNMSTAARDVERQICLRMDRARCRPVKDLTGGLSEAHFQGAQKAVLAWISAGQGFVDLAEASRRAEICRSCPFNRSAKACTCSWLFKLVERLVAPERRLPGLGVCGACGCSLVLKVLAPDPVILASNPSERVFPPGCWQAREALSDRTVVDIVGDSTNE